MEVVNELLLMALLGLCLPGPMQLDWGRRVENSKNAADSSALADDGWDRSDDAEKRMRTDERWKSAAF